MGEVADEFKVRDGETAEEYKARIEALREERAHKASEDLHRHKEEAESA